jgi:hypothetical protein
MRINEYYYECLSQINGLLLYQDNPKYYSILNIIDTFLPYFGDENIRLSLMNIYQNIKNSKETNTPVSDTEFRTKLFLIKGLIENKLQ